MRTESGLKDTHQLFFLEKLFGSYKGLRGRAKKQAALQEAIDALPDNITSPVWRIKGMKSAVIQSARVNYSVLGLDPHQDTPVEILHVILLGFVKYLWRDLIMNQIGTNSERKELLATRLCSFDVSGLGISPLAGHTLVQYTGSLTGRDFRVIAQVAPFVAYDLVSKDCLETWVALSKLIPLIWQPEIDDVDAHCVSQLTQCSVVAHIASLENRSSSTARSGISCFVPGAGRSDGITSPNFTFCSISQSTSAASALQSCSQPKLSNHSMPLSAPKVSTRTGMHPLAILHWPLPKATVFGIYSVVAVSSSTLLLLALWLPLQTL